MSPTDEPSSPSTVILTPDSSARSLQYHFGQDAATGNIPPSFNFERRVELAADPFTARYASSLESTNGEGHDDSNTLTSSPSSGLANSTLGDFSQRPMRAVPQPRSINLHRTHRPSYSFRNLYDATPEPPGREDQYPQISNARDASSYKGLSARITSFPVEREDAYLQAVSDHLPAFHTGNGAISSSDIDGIVRQTSNLAIENPVPRAVFEMEGSSKLSNSMTYQTQELPMESVINYARYDPMDEPAPRTLYFSRNFQEAIKSGRDVCGRIANTLQSCELAQDNLSQMYGLVRLAQELENFKSPVEVTIGIIGDSGAGKSSLINSLLHEDGLAKAMSFDGSACTNAITEYHQKRSHDRAKYTFEVDCMTREEIVIEIEKLLGFFRRFHANRTGLPAESIPTADELKEWENLAGVAWGTFHAVFGHYERLSKEFLKKDPDNGPSVQSILQQWLEELQWPLGLRGQGHSWESESSENGRNEMDESIGSFWPFVRVIRVYLSSQILKTGVVLVDLPGFNDTNAARVHVAEQHMYSCNELFVVTKSDRSVTHTGVEEVVFKCIGQKLDLLKPSQRISIICTHIDDASQKEAESLYKSRKPSLDKEGYERLQVLKVLIKKAKRAGKPYGALEAESKQIVMKAHGQIVQRGLLKRYGQHPTREKIPRIFCVANRLYDEYMEMKPEDSDEFEEMNIAMRSSGVPELREYCHGVPAQRQLDVAMHFLKVSIGELLNKLNLWLAEGAEDIGADKVKESLEEVSKKFQKESATGIQEFRTALMSVVDSDLMTVMSSKRSNWKQTAENWITIWHDGLYHATWRAIIRHNGVSNKDPANTMEWNLCLLKEMKADIEPAWFRFQYSSNILSYHKDGNLESQVETLKARTLGILTSTRLDRSIDGIYKEIQHYWEAEKLKFIKQLEEIYHNIITNRESSYVKKYMDPVYQACKDDKGDGICLRDVDRLQTAMRTPGLFVHIQKELKRHLEELIKGTTKELLRVLELYCLTLTADLELLQGNEAIVGMDEEFLDALRKVLDEAQVEMDHIVEQARVADQVAVEGGDGRDVIVE